MTIDEILAALPKLTLEDKQKLSDALADKLTLEQKAAINEQVNQIVSKWVGQLGKLATVIGFGSIAALVTTLVASIGYVFFWLPGQALDQAQERLEKRFAERLDARSKDIEERMTKVMEGYGQAQERYNTLKTRSEVISKDLESRASALDVKFKDLEQGPTAKAAQVVKAVQDNPIGSNGVLDVANLKIDVAALKSGADAASNRIDQLQREVVRQGTEVTITSVNPKAKSDSALLGVDKDPPLNVKVYDPPNNPLDLFLRWRIQQAPK